jgi:trehalose 2-sulfotransferase
VSLRDRLQATGKHFYCICFTLRSGSTLLCEDLTQWSLGAPTEFFQRPPAPGGRPLGDHVIETVTATPGPCFGFKVTWEQSFRFLERLYAEGEVPPSAHLADVFPELRFIHLVRQDKVAQAISIWRAVATGTWHWPVGQTIEKGAPGYDFEAIRTYLMHITAEDWLWEADLARRKLPAFRLEYEDYIARRAARLRAIVRFLHVSADRRPLVDRLNVMRDGWTDGIAAQVWRDIGLIPEPARAGAPEPAPAGDPDAPVAE